VSWQDLKDHCKQAGDVRHADVLLENGTGRSKGCGIVVFGTPRDAQNAIKMLHDTELKGRPIFVREDREAGAPQSSSRGAGAAPGCSVYVGNLAYEVSWQDLKDHCKQVGDVVRADVLLENGTGRSKG